MAAPGTLTHVLETAQAVAAARDAHLAAAAVAATPAQPAGQPAAGQQGGA